MKLGAGTGSTLEVSASLKFLPSEDFIWFPLVLVRIFILPHSCDLFKSYILSLSGKSSVNIVLPNVALQKGDGRHSTSWFTIVTYCRCWIYLSLSAFNFWSNLIWWGVRNFIWLLQGMSSNYFDWSLITSLNTRWPCFNSKIREGYHGGSPKQEVHGVAFCLRSGPDWKLC